MIWIKTGDHEIIDVSKAMRLKVHVDYETEMDNEENLHNLHNVAYYIVVAQFSENLSIELNFFKSKQEVYDYMDQLYQQLNGEHG